MDTGLDKYLTDNEKKVLRMRIDEERSFGYIANELWLSRQRIHQIFTSAVEKISKLLDAKNEPISNTYSLEIENQNLNTIDLTDDSVLTGVSLKGKNLRREWIEGYENLATFRKLSPDIWPKDGYYSPNGFPLSGWCVKQRRDRKKGIISKSRIKFLEDLGFPWS